MGQILSTTIPAPVDGMTTEIGLDVMGPTQALQMVNCYFQGGVIRRRPAISSLYSTGYPEGIGTLLVYNKVDGTQELVGSYSTTAGLRKFTSGGASLIGGTGTCGPNLSAAHARTLAGGTLLFVCDGSNRVGVYNGATFNNAGFTIGGAADSSLEVVTVYQNRLFFSKKNTCEIYYTPTASITGALSTYEVGFYFQRGGKIIWIGTWSGNAGSGLDDFFVVASSNGEILIFKGSDPASAVNWSMVGRYFIPSILSTPSGIPKPNNYTNFHNKDSDILIMTQDGIYTLSSVVSLGQGDTLQGITENIRGLYRDLYLSSVLDKQSITYCSILQSIFIGVFSPYFNRDTEETKYYSGFLVYNLLNSSWSFYSFDPYDTGFLTAVSFNNGFYFSMNTLTNDIAYMEANTFSNSDYFGDIPMKVQTSFNYLNDRSLIKRFISAAPILSIKSGVALKDVEGQCTALCNNKVINTTDESAALANGTFTTSPEGPNIAWLNAWGKSVSLIFNFPKTTYRTAISAINVIYELGGYE